MKFKDFKEFLKDVATFLHFILYDNNTDLCDSPATFFLYSSGLWRYMAAASPFSGSIGFGYVSSCGRKDSKMFDRSEMEVYIRYWEKIEIWKQNKALILPKEMRLIWGFALHSMLIFYKKKVFNVGSHCPWVLFVSRINYSPVHDQYLPMKTIQ